MDIAMASDDGDLSTIEGHERCFRCEGKQIDNFRNKPGEVQEGVLLDDSNLATIHIEV